MTNSNDIEFSDVEIEKFVNDFRLRLGDDYVNQIPTFLSSSLTSKFKSITLSKVGEIPDDCNIDDYDFDDVDSCMDVILNDSNGAINFKNSVFDLWNPFLDKCGYDPSELILFYYMLFESLNQRFVYGLRRDPFCDFHIYLSKLKNDIYTDPTAEKLHQLQYPGVILGLLVLDDLCVLQRSSEAISSSGTLNLVPEINHLDFKNGVLFLMFANLAEINNNHSLILRFNHMAGPFDYVIDHLMVFYIQVSYIIILLPLLKTISNGATESFSDDNLSNQIHGLSLQLYNPMTIIDPNSNYSFIDGIEKLVRHPSDRINTNNSKSYNDNILSHEIFITFDEFSKLYDAKLKGQFSEL